MEYTYEEVHEAYVKLKTYIYYDSSNLFMRKQLAVFETGLDDDLDIIGPFFEYKNFEKKYQVAFEEGEENELADYEKKLRVFTAALNAHHENGLFFKTMLDRITTKFLPKKIMEEKKESKIITNKRTSVKYVIERSAVFIDAPIEIHLIAVLWIMRKGVGIDRNLFSRCYGNRLILNKEEEKVVKGSSLFKPYPKQYQKWRDEAINTARDHLSNGENVLILNLDIRDFFYSVRIPRGEIDNSPYSNRAPFASLNNLYDVFGKIHEIFTKKLIAHQTPYDFTNEVTDDKGNISHYILPIGLLSSFVLANHHLTSFDNRIIKHVRPIYYGRYVDDILMVIANPVLPHEHVDDTILELNFNYEDYRNWIKASPTHDEFEKSTAEDYEELSDLEQFVLRNFQPTITLINKPTFLKIEKEPDNNQVFKLNGFERLYCQSGKTLLYYFDKDESTMVIDKLKRDLEEKSSEFRNYTDAEDAEDFEESAYHLLYDGTEGKVRTLKDYKENKFGLTVYLSKRIFNALRRDDKISNQEAEKIVRFFQGCNALNLFTLWERILVFLLVNKKPEAYVHFYLNCCDAIKKIEMHKSMKKIRASDYQNHVLEYLDCANELALSLNPRFISEVRKVKRTYEFSFNALKKELDLFSKRYSPTDENAYYISRFRRSNLVRHHYISQPLLSYTKTSPKDFRDFTDISIPF